MGIMITIFVIFIIMIGVQGGSEFRGTVPCRSTRNSHGRRHSQPQPWRTRTTGDHGGEGGGGIHKLVARQPCPHFIRPACYVRWPLFFGSSPRIFCLAFRKTLSRGCCPRLTCLAEVQPSTQESHADPTRDWGWACFHIACGGCRFVLHVAVVVC